MIMMEGPWHQEVAETQSHASDEVRSEKGIG